ncbi:MAG TPA: lipoprotein insertase outer membrane protein LolB, partial [Burkholderiales bacterium]|nr:lipoprotein insertase outer membrane protein LolB [Burkholderiales bacterium]
MAGCAAVPERPPLADPVSAWKARQVALVKIDVWGLRGRVALRSGETGGQASLQWKREGDTHRIEISGPIGGSRLRLTQDRSGAELHDAEGRTDRDVSLQRLLQRRTGWDLPFKDLNYWVRGLQALGPVERSEIDPWGRLTLVEQDGWEVRFSEYSQQGQFELPSRIVARRL